MMMEEKNHPLSCFMEPIDYTLDASVPDPVGIVNKLQSLLDQHKEFILTEEEKELGRKILGLVGEYSTSSKDLESEQEREQEQEQQREVKAKRDQEIEIEKFVDREYTRADEQAHPWHYSILAKPPPTQTDKDHPFRELSQFRLRHQEPLQFPSFLFSSRNYFNPEWAGLRRVKNVTIVMEWIPSLSEITNLEEQPQLTAQVAETLEKSFKLFAPGGKMTRIELFHAIRAATDRNILDSELDEILSEFGDESKSTISSDGFYRLMVSGRLHPIEKGRFYVAVSLAEAETLRRLIHIRKNNFLNDCSVALWYTPMSTDTGPIVFDSSITSKVQQPTSAASNMISYQKLVAHHSMRFLDSSMHFSEPALNILVRALHSNSPHARERFYYTTIASRRRMERKWQDTPLAKVFTVPDEWFALKQRAQAVFMRQAIRNKQLTLWEAFMAFDSDDNGVLSPAEFYGAIRWLGIPDLSPNEVVDMIESADTNHDGFIDYKEYLQLLKDEEDIRADEDEEKEEEEEEEDQDEEERQQQQEEKEDDHTNSKLRKNSHADEDDREEASDVQRLLHKPIVEPFGAEILREVMIQRKRDEISRQREDRLRQLAFQQSLDIRVFEEELLASKKRKGGPNPKLVELSKTSRRCVSFSFTENQKPLRMVPHGNVKFKLLHGQTILPFVTQSKATRICCTKGHPLSLVTSGRYASCYFCKISSSKYFCLKGCSFGVCIHCNTLHLDEFKRSLLDFNGKHTYLECTSGSSFTLQIPVFLSSVPMQVMSTRFTIVMEVKMDRLPPRGQLAALLRLSPTSASSLSLSSSSSSLNRQKNEATVYVDEFGNIGYGKALISKQQAGLGSNQSNSISYLAPQLAILEPLSCEGRHPLTWFTATSGFSCNVCHRSLSRSEKMLGCRKCDYDICLPCFENHEKKRVMVTGGGTSSNQKSGFDWRTIAIVVNDGNASCYSNGVLSSVISELSREELTLQHQIILFGGSKQGHLRGGCIRQLKIYNDCLSEEDLSKLSKRIINSRIFVVIWCCLNQNSAHEAIVKDIAKNGEFEVIQVSSKEEALESISTHRKRIQCVVVTLTGEFLYEDDIEASILNEENSIKENGGMITEEQKHIAAIPGYKASLELREHLPLSIPILLDCTSPSLKKKFLLVGERVQSLYQNGKNYFEGTVTKVHGETDTYDIIFPSLGQVEEKVPMKNIKPFHVSKVANISLTPEEEAICLSKKVDLIQSADLLQDQVCLSLLKQNNGSKHFETSNYDDEDDDSVNDIL